MIATLVLVSLLFFGGDDLGLKDEDEVDNFDEWFDNVLK